MIQIKIFVVTMIAVLVSIVSLCGPSFAQAETDELTRTILSRDAAFWAAYNSCSVDDMGTFFTDDVEFYHDKGGPTLGLVDLVASLHKFCDSQKITRIQRDAAPDSIKIFPMRNGGAIYGAVISGQHYFYTQEKGKKERRDGLARFTHLWLQRDGVWKMSRVLSYDHGPAPYVNERTALKLTPSLIRQYAGEYDGPRSKVAIQMDKGILTLVSDNMKMALYPESKTIFFSKERDLTFEFLKDANGKIAKMTVRENGEIAEEMLRQK